MTNSHRGVLSGRAVISLLIAAILLQFLPGGTVSVSATPVVPAYVQGAGATSSTSGTTIAKAFTSNNVAGNSIVVSFTWDNTSNPTCSDSRGNIYALGAIHRDVAESRSVGVCYTTNITAGANTVTVTFSAAVVNSRIIVNEYSGLSSANAIDAVSVNTALATTTSNAVTSTAATTTSNGDLIFGAVMDTDAAVTTIAAGTGFTQRQSLNAKDFATQDEVQTTAGSVASTQTFGAAKHYVAIMIAFRPNGTPAATTPVQVQSTATSSDTSLTTIAKAFNANNTAGNAIVAAFSWDNTANPVCTDSAGNHYTLAAIHRDVTKGRTVGVCYTTSIASGANTVTVTFSAATSFRRLAIHEYSGVATSNALDVIAVGGGTATTTANAVTTASATTATNGDLIFGAVLDAETTTSTVIAGTGFLQRQSLNDKDLATQDRIQTTAGSIASTQTFGAAHNYVAVMVAFKPTSAPAAASPIFVQSAGTTGSTASTTIAQAFNVPTSIHNAIVAAVSWAGSSSLTCTDSNSNTYTTIATQYDSTNTQSVAVCYALNVAGGADTVTATFGSSTTNRRLIVNEYNGLARFSAVDVSATGVGTATTTANAVTTSSATTTANSDLIFGAVVDTNLAPNLITAGSSFTQRYSLNDKDFAVQDRIQPTAGSIASTQTFGATHRYAASMVAFKYVPPTPGSAVTYKLTWSGNTDLDLYVTDPTGTLDYYGNPGPSATGGVFSGDSGCPGTGSHNETQVWNASAPAGVYSAHIDQYNTCGGSSASWTLQVIKDGTVVATNTGTGSTTSDITYTEA